MGSLRGPFEAFKVSLAVLMSHYEGVSKILGFYRRFHRFDCSRILYSCHSVPWLWFKGLKAF